MKRNRFLIIYFCIIVTFLQCQRDNDFDTLNKYLIKNEYCDSLVVEYVENYDKPRKVKKLENIKSYNTQNELIEKVSFDLNGKKMHSEIYYYNFHLLNKIEAYDNYGKLKFIKHYNIKSEIGQDSKTIENITYSYKNNKKEKIYIERKKYDVIGKIIEEFIHYPLAIKNPQIEKYKYDRDNNLIEKTTLKGYEDKNPSKDRYKYYYSDEKKLLKTEIINYNSIYTEGMVVGTKYYLEDTLNIRKLINDHINSNGFDIYLLV